MVVGWKTPGLTAMAGVHLAGLVLVLDPERLDLRFRSAGYQFWRANGGFGCNPDVPGSAVFATCLHDGEQARWERHHFIGIASPSLVTTFFPDYYKEQQP